jgi:oxygen-dependent protoporphyrinogen oxidase
VTLGAMLGWSMRRDTAEKSEAAPVRRGMFSFREGMGSLVRAMADRLPAGSIHARSVADALEPQPDGTYLVRYHDAHDPTMTSEVRARRVIIALPPRATGALLQPTVAPTAEVLTSVDLCRVAVVHFGGPDPEGIAPKGFGVLIPPGEGLRTLGILMPSSVFPERAPAGHWLHTGFVGGAGDPDAADLTDETLLNLVRRAQQHAFGHHYPGRQLECNFHAVVRWRDAIPQYRPGHRDAMAAALAAVESHLPGVTLAGNYLAGVSVNDAAQSGWDAASRLATVKAGATSLQGAR